jgi:XTP/dITP diphosphohydrolase
MKLLIATTNTNKVREIRPLLGSLSIELVTLRDFDPIPEPDETGTTFWENARLKALAYAAATGLTVVAEDSGLEIAALGGDPGVQSARFLGPGIAYPVRFDEIYRRMAQRPHPSRDARFVTALTLARGEAILFETEASVEGLVAEAPAGQNGFGYDPIFFYPPLGKTTGEMTLADKGAVSHRARAFRDLARWLKSARPDAHSD